VTTIVTDDVAPLASETPAGVEDPSTWDCQACGACCRNLDTNRASGVRYWVEISPDDKLLTRHDLVRKLVTHDRHRVPHLRMTHEGVCEALRGTIGQKVRCSIYHQRPSPCRRVMPGDETCLKTRAAHGLPTNAAPAHDA
jgi:Fe-S-cluster containining protein